ncbi:MAG: hypothetical protein DWI64_02825 [Chloroflexi bacterium]|nr:MAG: hypothetical protein DWI64_02825 [Chloroflexota bacterium]
MGCRCTCAAGSTSVTFAAAACGWQRAHACASMCARRKCSSQLRWASCARWRAFWSWCGRLADGQPPAVSLSIICWRTKNIEELAMRIGTFLAGVICGGVVASAAVLLFSPLAGDELRARLREQVDYLLADARDAAQGNRRFMERRLQHLSRRNA